MSLSSPGEGIRKYGEDYLALRETVLSRAGVDLADYKSEQMHRRIDAYRQRRGFNDFRELASKLDGDEDELRLFSRQLTINVTGFFRNPEQWEILRAKVIPALARAAVSRGHTLKVWSAGTSMGQEAYSLAIALHESASCDYTVLATDIDKRSLDKAESGRYTEEELAGVPKASLAMHFSLLDGHYTVRDHIRKRVTIKKHNLLSEPYPTDMHLILCRNVLIYLNAGGKARVLRDMAGALVPYGVLFTGSAEALVDAGKHGLVNVFPFIYALSGHSGFLRVIGGDIHAKSRIHQPVSGIRTSIPD